MVKINIPYPESCIECRFLLASITIKRDLLFECVLIRQRIQSPSDKPEECRLIKV